MRPKSNHFIFVFAGFLFGFAHLLPAETSVPPLQETEAYQRYIRGPRSELAKLLCLIGRYHGSPLKVIYAGDAYDSMTAIQFARLYLARNYRNEKADRWIKNHLTMRGPDGESLLVRFPDGKKRPAADVLLEELKNLSEENSSLDLVSPR